MKTKFEKWFLFLAVLICVYGCAIGNQEPYDPFIDLEPGSAKIQIGDRMFQGEVNYENTRWVNQKVNEFFIKEIKRPVSGIIHDQGSIRIRFQDVDLVNRRYDLNSSIELISASHFPPGGHWSATSGSVTIHKIGVSHIEGKFEFTMRTIGSVFPTTREYKGGFNALIVEDE
ncbi:MAG: hypothetical protein ACNA8K_14650 [Cyclonatronaceae bacterium]|jgi:hypothetical protein